MSAEFWAESDRQFAAILQKFGGAEAGRRFDERSERYLYPERVAAREEAARLERERVARIADLSVLATEAFASFALGMQRAAAYLQVQLFGTPEQKAQADRLWRAGL